jgi:hypothetical protein
VDVPASWSVYLDPEPSVSLICLEPPDDDPGGFNANLVLTVSDLAGMSFSHWQSTTERALHSALNDYFVIELERLHVLGAPGGRRLAHHTTPAGVPVTLEQWFSCLNGSGYTLTLTIDTPRYTPAATILADIAASIRLTPSQQPPSTQTPHRTWPSHHP